MVALWMILAGAWLQGAQLPSPARALEIPGKLNPAPALNAMDFLYSDSVPLSDQGEPLVKTGIGQDLDTVRLHAPSGLHLTYFENGKQRRAWVPGNQTVVVSVAAAAVPQRVYQVDLGVVPAQPGIVAQALGGWRARGLAQIHAHVEGVLLEVNGVILDNREAHLVLEAASADAAQKRATQLSTQLGVRAQVRDRPATRPSGTLALQAGGLPVGHARDYVQISADKGVVEVEKVEFGRGYRWHGFENRAYHGDVYAVVDPNGSMALVNVLGAESMLLGVVPAEIYPSSPSEALKAQAVAARNTLLAGLGRRHPGAPFHMCSEQHCQVYVGASREDLRTTTAVFDTAGEALFFGKRLVNAVYSASCGGYTEDNDAVWNEQPDDALRARPDFLPQQPLLAPFLPGITPENIDAFVHINPQTYCSNAATARPDKIRWQRTLMAPQLQAALAAKYRHIGTLQRVGVGKRGKGGRVVELALAGTKGRDVVRGELVIRQLFGNLSSAVFTVEPDIDDENTLQSVTFVGAGWGHGVGMCQLGAIGRAQRGMRYHDILGYYYNGASLTQLWHDFGQKSAPQAASR